MVKRAAPRKAAKEAPKKAAKEAPKKAAKEAPRKAAKKAPRATAGRSKRRVPRNPPRNPPRGLQRIIPYLVCRDPGAMLDFVVRCFGFRVLERITAPDGTVMHAEAGFASNVVMLGFAGPEPAPGRPGLCSMLYLYVDDVDALFARAEGAGATVVQPLMDQFYGDRTGAVADPEGNHWYLATHTRDVSAAEIARAMG